MLLRRILLSFIGVVAMGVQAQADHHDGGHGNGYGHGYGHGNGCGHGHGYGYGYGYGHGYGCGGRWGHNGWCGPSFFFGASFYPAPIYYGPVGYYDAYYDCPPPGRVYRGYVVPSRASVSEGRYSASVEVDVQRSLARLGYYHGAIDGVIGPAGRSAIRRYQRDHDLQATGQVSYPLLRSLRLA